MANQFKSQKEYYRKWYKNNSERVKLNVRKWKEQNPEKVKLARKKRRDKDRSMLKDWRTKNRALICVHSAKKRCMKTGMVFNLDKAWVKQNYTGYCALTGIPFIPDGTRSPYAVSLDRIDNQKGYLKNNCRFVLFGVNTFKGSGTDNDMYFIAERLLKKRKGFKP